MCKINPRVDFAFKVIFGSEQNKDILLSLLNSILEDYQTAPIEEIDILNPYGEKDFPKDKLTILDIRAKDERGEYYNIEMQITEQTYYAERALYYWARLYSSQISEGIGFSKLRRTVSINILNFDMLKSKDRYHNVYRLKELKDNTELSNHIEVHFIELEKFTKELPDLKRTLDRWIYFLKYAEKFSEKNLPEPLKGYAPIEKANRVLDRLSLSEIEREIYEARLKTLRDEDGALATARLKGVEEGMEMGKKEEKFEIARKLLSINLPLDQIAGVTGLSEEEIRKMFDL